mgnify:CR=1 FL=1
MAERTITITKNFDLNKISLDLTKELNLAGGMVVKDIVKKNQSGLDINGKTIKPLSPNTIAAKSGSDPSRALYDTGRMIGRGSVKGVGGRGPYLSKKAKKTDQETIISVAKDRESIGVYHNEGTKPYTITPKRAKKLSFITKDGWVNASSVNHPGLPKREWFGISKDAIRDIMRMVELKIEDRIKRA